jgi:hypothetical protein
MDLDTYNVLWIVPRSLQNGFPFPFGAYAKAERVTEYTWKATIFPALNLVVLAVVNRPLGHVPVVVQHMIGLTLSLKAAFSRHLRLQNRASTWG